MLTGYQVTNGGPCPLPTPAAESDSEWPMDQDETIDSLLCESPSLLPTLSLSMTHGPEALAGAPAAAPATAAPPPPPASSTAAPDTVSDHNQGKGIKVRSQAAVEESESSDVSASFLMFLPLLTDQGGEHHPTD